MKGNKWQVAVLAVGLVLALPALNIGFSNATHEFAGNQAATVDYGANTTIDEDPFEFNETIDVFHDDPPVELTEGEDYEWHPSTGNVTWLDSSVTTDGESATINYTYFVHDEATKNSSGILTGLSPALGLLLLIAVCGTLFTWHAIGSDGGGF